MNAQETHTEMALATTASAEAADDRPVFTGTSWEDHVKAWQDVRGQIADYQWQLGAVAASMATKYGDRALDKFAKQVGDKRRTVYTYQQVYLRFGHQPRLPNLTYSHYRAVVAAPNAEELLQQASQEALPTRAIERMAVQRKVSAEFSLSDMVAISLDDEQRAGIWVEYQRAARAMMAHFPLLRDAVRSHIDELEYEMARPPMTVRARICVLIGDGFNTIETITQRLAIKRPDGREVGLPREGVIALLQRMVTEGDVREDHRERAPGARGAEQLIFKLTPTGAKLARQSSAGA